MGLKPDFLLHGKNINHVSEWSTEENIWLQQGASDRRLEKTAHSGTL
jgi:hypothetical protein